MALQKLTRKAKDLVPMNWGKRPVRVRDESREPLPASTNEFRRMFDGLFEDFFSRRFGENWLSPPTEPLAGFDVGWPRIDLEETEKEFKVTAEVPGMEAENIDVTLGDHSLIIRGSKTSDREERNKGYRLKETFSGSFYRTIPLSAEVDRERVEANCKNGQLRLSLPKTADGRAAAKKIEVK
jgi:HSP20 family protein